jgi:hypothetical protein
MWPERDRPPREDAEPYGWWGFGWEVPDPLSVVDLIAAGNFDVRTAALLWLLIEARASIVVAADPPGAGKTTTLTALSDFLPPGWERIYLRGWNETFAFTATADPARSYILCNEISAHLPVYLWGRKVQQLFDALGAGFAFGATMHADEPEEVIGILAGYPLYVPLPAIARLDLIMTLAVDYVERRPRRRLDRLTLLRRDGEGETLDPVSLARWDAAAGGVVGFAGAPPPGLLRRAGLGEVEFAMAWARRTEFLAALVAGERQDRASVRRTLAAFGG